MTKNAAAKKAARAYASSNRTSYTAGRRLTRADGPADPSAAPTSPLSVEVTYEFSGPDTPAPFQIDATWWLEELPWHFVVALQENGWVYDPSGPEDLVAPPELLGRVADQAPELATAAAWVRAQTVSGSTAFTVPDQSSPTGEATLAEFETVFPYRMVFDASAAQRWLAARGPLYHLTLHDLVTPAERRQWLEIHNPGRYDCSAGRHHFDGSPSPYIGECSGCGAKVRVKHTDDGEEYEAIVDAGEFFAEAVAAEAFCNWAPPTLMLEGDTQAEWHEANRPSAIW